MIYEKGCALDKFESENNIILVHGCNSYDLWLSGIAKQIKEKYPRAYSDIKHCLVYSNKTLTPVARNHYILGSKAILGGITSVKIDSDNRVLVNAYTQQFKSDENTKTVLYDAVDECFKILAKVAIDFTSAKKGVKIIYPKIGSGVANGHWPIIREIIDHRLKGYDHICMIK